MSKTIFAPEKMNEGGKAEFASDSALTIGALPKLDPAGIEARFPQFALCSDIKAHTSHAAGGGGHSSTTLRMD
ncbi:MAG: hypothetical protein NTV65_00995 [Proteobacteria bacterium]|nr:hypothetical protein [Pseudomonadota bacterium]